MARHVRVSLRGAGLGVTGLTMGWMACLISTGRAQQPMQPMQPAAPMTEAAPPKTPATNAAPMPPLDTFGQYGKIITPSDQAAHPLKLKMPYPGVGEVKIPNGDEMKMREKLEDLAKLSDTEIRSQLEVWPAYSNMSLRDQGSMLQRIQDFRDFHVNVAKSKAHEMGLLTLTPEQQAKFEKDYWDKKLQMDHELARQFEPIFKAREQKMRDELFREFSMLPPGPIAQVPKPGTPPAPATNSVASAAKPPAPAAPKSDSAVNSMPMAQAPK